MPKTKVHLFKYDERRYDSEAVFFNNNSHIVSYAGEYGLLHFCCQFELDWGKISELANKVNDEFIWDTVDEGGGVTLLPQCLVRRYSEEHKFPTIVIIERMLEEWKVNITKNKKNIPESVVFMITDFFNSEITEFHEKLYREGYDIPGVKDLYVWTMRGMADE